MHEPLTTALVGEELKRLFAVFPSKLAAQNVAFTAETYKNGLRGIDGQALRGAVEIVIQNDSYFPKVARLREAAGVWTKHNRPRLAPRVEPAWNVCPVCGARAESPEITRPKKYQDGGQGYYVVAREYRTEVAHVAAGARIPASGLLDALARGIILETETVPNPRTVINHDAAKHQIVKGEPDEYQGVA